MKFESIAICVALLVIIVVSILLLTGKKKERFAAVGSVATLPDGTYSIRNVLTQNYLKTSIVDTVQCNNFLIGQQPQATTELGWNISKVADGVYKLNKMDGNECLYTSPQNTLRSYLNAGCKMQNLCGLSKPDYKGELDQDSLRTYFMLLLHPESGNYYIRSMKNNMYVTMNNDKLFLSPSPTDYSLFTFSKMY